ncbi:hypothetical protein Q9189_005608 [Teloschistes chrysophthalmus]
MWPPLRRPGCFTGNDEGWLHEEGTPSTPEDRNALNLDRRLSTCSVTGTLSVPNIQALKTEHGIAPSTTLKAAFALAIMGMTEQTTAVFSNYQAGRQQWPFVEDFVAHSLPSPVSIAGPTLTAVVNRFAIDPATTVLSFLRDAESEQALLTKYSHAPYSRIRKELEDNDRAVYNEAMSGLCFDWLPVWQTPHNHDDPPNMDEEEGGEVAPELNVVCAELHPDRVAVLQCGLVSEREASVTMRYDNCQIGAEEAERAIRVFGMCAGWVCRRENWKRRFREGG